MTTPQLIVWCQHDGCPELRIPSDPRHIPNLHATWRCKKHTTTNARSTS